MKNNNLLKFLLLFNGVLSILAGCPSYPTIPTTSIPKTDPIVLTSTSEGMISFNPSLTKLAITMTVTLDEECPEDGWWNLFTLTVTPDGGSETEMAEFYVDCNSFNLYGYAWSDEERIASEIWKEGSSKTVNIYVAIDLENKEMYAEANSADSWGEDSFSSGGILLPPMPLPPMPLPPMPLTPILPPVRRLRSVGNERVLEGEEVTSFDETTKLYLCSYSDGAESARACTVSRLQLVSMYDDELPSHLGDFTPVTHAFYPLNDGTLSSLITSADPAYFGDSASSPTEGSSPSWDSSKTFVQITKETEFLTLPIPSMTENSIHIPTMTFAFWTRVTSIPQESSVLFSVILEDETTAFSIVVSQETLELSGILGEDTGMGMEMAERLKITLNTWQLISCNLYVIPNFEVIFLALSVGDSKTLAITLPFGELTPTKLRIGHPENSFIGDISSARILSPGAGYLTNSDVCSPNNAIEINSGPYAISCAEGSSLNPFENKCYSSCPKDTKTVTPFTDAPFTLCFPEGSSVAVEESSSGGLSGGAIAGIVIGSVAGVAMIAAVGYFAKLKLAKSVAAKKGAKAYQMKSPTTTENIATTTNMVSP